MKLEESVAEQAENLLDQVKQPVGDPAVIQAWQAQRALHVLLAAHLGGNADRDFAAVVHRLHVVGGIRKQLSARRQALAAKRRFSYWRGWSAVALIAVTLAVAFNVTVRMIVAAPETTLAVNTVRLAFVPVGTKLIQGTHVQPAMTGMLLNPGDVVHCDQAGAVFTWPDGTTVTGDAGLRLSVGEDKKIQLVAGRLVAEVTHQQPGSEWQIATPEALATVVGTRFTLGTSAGVTKLSVSEGAVRLRTTTHNKNTDESTINKTATNAASNSEALVALPVEQLVAVNQRGTVRVNAAPRVDRLRSLSSSGEGWTITPGATSLLMDHGVDTNEGPFISLRGGSAESNTTSYCELPLTLVGNEIALRLLVKSTAVDERIDGVINDKNAKCLVNMTDSDGDRWVLGTINSSVLEAGWQEIDLPLPSSPGHLSDRSETGDGLWNAASARRLCIGIAQGQLDLKIAGLAWVVMDDAVSPTIKKAAKRIERDGIR